MSTEKDDTGGWTADDAIMADLRSWLVDQGFAVIGDRYHPDSFSKR
jgi:hypothetical protein